MPSKMHTPLSYWIGNIILINYNSYGASDGYPSQHGITKDAQVCSCLHVFLYFSCQTPSEKCVTFIHGQAALDHLSQRSDIDTSRIVVFGRSLGGAVGAVLTKNNPDKVSLW